MLISHNLIPPMTESSDHRHSPATVRNREPILAVLQAELPPQGTLLEIASGTGEHGVFMAPQLQPRHWLPSDLAPEARASIAAWQQVASTATLHAPLAIDVCDPAWPDIVTTWQQTQGDRLPPISAVMAMNMIHIAPWAACEGLMAGAGKLLPADGVLYLYGPFRQGDQPFAPSNAAFDQSLRSRHPEWGIRDLDAVVAVAATHGLGLKTVIPMPANNLSVVLQQPS